MAKYTTNQIISLNIIIYTYDIFTNIAISQVVEKVFYLLIVNWDSQKNSVEPQPLEKSHYFHFFIFMRLEYSRLMEQELTI